MTHYNKPLPGLDGLTKEFYDFCRQESLHFQQCSECGTFRHVPREMCAECNSFDWEWVESSGKGTIFSWVVVNRALHPAFYDPSPDAVPMAPVVVEMEEGVRLTSNMVDCPPDELEIDMPVEVVYEAVTDEVTLPRFRRVTGG
ncbi:DNA-binding protein [Seongchinamella sediminis]|uniref:DNA-binding protein n=1 Tax=Seongchinamella sediminis TaxID=2283635 RepID=A0A3L7DY18_9GAMM|nr:OB-fold domain-containing protein [Seongchinamella sediminis]RLQ21083.1 DNA-binding protein [Seongchinamella sediminis]